MRSQIRGLNQASANASNGISFIQVAEAYLQETTDIMQRIRELAVQASNGIYSAEDRMQIQVEVSQLVAEVDRIASSAQFNGMNMLTGRFARDAADNQLQLHVGANMDQSEKLFVGTMTALALGLTGGMQGGEGDMNAGCYRQHNVLIKGSAHTPPDFMVVPELMEELLQFINHKDPPQFDLVKIAQAHHRFVWIHPRRRFIEQDQLWMCC